MLTAIQFWLFMESKNQKNTGSYYPLNHGSLITVTDSTHKLNKILNWIYNHPIKAIIEIIIAVIAGVIAGLILKNFP